MKPGWLDLLFMFFTSIAVSLMWMAIILGTLASGQRLAVLETYTTLVVQALSVLSVALFMRQKVWRSSWHRSRDIHILSFRYECAPIFEKITPEFSMSEMTSARVIFQKEKLKSDPGVEHLMIHTTDLRDKISNLFRSQFLAVLASQKDGQSYANLVAFAATEDLRNVLFSTSRSTRKFSHIQDNPQVALLVDNRSNSSADFMNALAVTALGKAREVCGTERESLTSIYLAKHPHLCEFISSPNQALLKVEVSRYILVSNFQRVLEMDVDE